MRPNVGVGECNAGGATNFWGGGAGLDENQNAWVNEYEELVGGLTNEQNDVRLNAEKHLSKLKQDEQFIEKCWKILFISSNVKTHFVASTLLRQVSVYHWIKKQNHLEKCQKKMHLTASHEESERKKHDISQAINDLKNYEHKVYSLVVTVYNFLKETEEKIIKQSDNSGSQDSSNKHTSSSTPSSSNLLAPPSLPGGGGEGENGEKKRKSSFSTPFGLHSQNVYRQLLHIICLLLKRGLIVNYDLFSPFIFSLLQSINQLIADNYNAYLHINNINNNNINNINACHHNFLLSSLNFSVFFSFKILTELTDEINNSRLCNLQVQWSDYIKLRKMYETNIFIYLFAYSINFLYTILISPSFASSVSSSSSLLSYAISSYFSSVQLRGDISNAVIDVCSSSSSSSSSSLHEHFLSAQVKFCVKILETFVEWDYTEMRSPAYRGLTDYVSPSPTWLYIFFPILLLNKNVEIEGMSDSNSNNVAILKGGGLPTLWGGGGGGGARGNEGGSDGEKIKLGGMTSFIYIVHNLYKILCIRIEKMKREGKINDLEYMEEEDTLKKLRFVLTRLSRIRVVKMLAPLTDDIRNKNMNNYLVCEYNNKRMEEEKNSFLLLYDNDGCDDKQREILVINYITTNYLISPLLNIYANLLFNSKYYRLFGGGRGGGGGNMSNKEDMFDDFEEEENSLVEFHDLSFAVSTLAEAPDISKDLYKNTSEDSLKIFLNIIDNGCMRLSEHRNADCEKEFECLNNLLFAISLCAYNMINIRIDLVRKKKQLTLNVTDSSMNNILNMIDNLYKWIDVYEGITFNVYEVITTKYLCALCNDETLLYLSKKYLTNVHNVSSTQTDMSTNMNIIKDLANERGNNSSDIASAKWEDMYTELHDFMHKISNMARVRPTQAAHIILCLLNKWIEENERSKMKNEDNLEVLEKINSFILLFSHFIIENPKQQGVFSGLRVPRTVFDNLDLQKYISEILRVIFPFIKNEFGHLKGQMGACDEKRKQKIKKIINAWLVFIGRIVSAYLLKTEYASIKCVEELTSAESGREVLEVIINILCEILSTQSSDYLLSYACVFVFKLLCNPQLPTVVYSWESGTYQQLLNYSIDVKNSYFSNEYFIKNLNIKNIRNLFCTFSLSTNESEYIRTLAKQHIDSQGGATLQRSGTMISKEVAHNRLSAFLNACNFIKDDLQMLAQKENFDILEIKKIVIEINMFCGMVKGVISNKKDLLFWLGESKIYEVLLFINQKQNTNIFTILHSLRYMKNIIAIGLHEMEKDEAEKVLSFTDSLSKIFCKIYMEKINESDFQDEIFRGIRIILKILHRIIEKQHSIKIARETISYFILSVFSSINHICANPALFTAQKLSLLYIRTMQIFIEENPDVVLTNMQAQNYQMIAILLRMCLLSGNVRLRHPAYECLHAIAANFSEKVDEIFLEEENKIKSNSQLQNAQIENVFFIDGNIFALNTQNTNKFAVLLNELAQTALEVLLHIVFEEPSAEALNWFVDLLFDVLLLLSFRSSFTKTFFFQFTATFASRIRFIEEENISAKCIIMTERFGGMREHIYGDKNMSRSLRRIKYTQQQQSFHEFFGAFIAEFLQQL